MSAAHAGVLHAYDYALVRVVPRPETGDGEAVGVALHARRAGVFALVLADTPDALAEHRPTIEAYEKLCADLGHDPADVALAWLLSRPGVTAPIIGPRTLDQLDRSLGALTVDLDESTLKRLDDLFPPVGNGGPGPEAWAW